MPQPTPAAPPNDPPPAPDRAAPLDRAAFIDQLMAQPIKGRPKITVVGDDAVSGINPLPTPPKADA